MIENMQQANKTEAVWRVKQIQASNEGARKHKNLYAIELN